MVANLCQSGKKRGTMGDGFIAWQGNLPLQSWLGSNSQFHTPKSTVGNALVNMLHK